MGSAMKMQLKNAHFYLMLLGDALLFAAALVLAYLFRFEFSLDAFFAAATQDDLDSDTPGEALHLLPVRSL